MALGLGTGHALEQQEEGRGLDLRGLGYVEGLHQARRPEARVGARAARHPHIDLCDPGVPAGCRCFRPSHSPIDRERRHRAPHCPAGALRGHPIRRHRRVPTARGSGLPRIRQGDRRWSNRGPGAAEGAGPGGGGRQEVPDIAALIDSATKGGGVRASAAAAFSRDAWARRLPLLPAFIYVFLVTQVPFVLTIYYSFFSWNLLKPGSFRFSGLDNYVGLITDESTRIAVWNTVLLTVSVIAISVILGTGVAMLLNSEVFGKGLMRTLMIAPFLIMPTAGALIWKHTLLNPLYGLLPWLLTPFGLNRVDFVGQAPMVTVVTVEVWRWTSFMMLIILAGLH